jgi:hypothetical protein
VKSKIQQIDNRLQCFDHAVMKPSVIITDPKKISQICSQQPRVSRGRAIQSILAQNGKSSSQVAVKVS